MSLATFADQKRSVTASNVGSTGIASSSRSSDSVKPTAAVRTFGVDEIIVSKTDLQGRITYVNDVFLRVAGYREADVLGKPHNLIRHPDMPRVVFSLLWSEIQAGREIFAYVKNMAIDGAAYWVFAHVTPTYVGGAIVGYHSNRRSPEAGAVRAIEPLYRLLLAEEARHSRPSEAMAASGALMTEKLAQLKMTYDEFVWSLADSRSGTGPSIRRGAGR
jgi:PAS domain S-box-containing protein